MASDPLAALLGTIRTAQELPAASDYTPTEDPLSALRTLVQSKGDAPKQSTLATAAPDSDLAAEIVEVLGRIPLSGPARIRALKAGLIAKRNPTPENIQAVLDILVGG